MWSSDIRAPRKAVWNALTAPGQVQRFYFDSLFEADLRPGGALRYATRDGNRTFMRGTVVEIAPLSRFAHTFRFTDLPESEQRVVFELAEVHGATRLTIRHEGLERAPRHGRRVQKGWTRILDALKHYLEHGSLPFSARLRNGVMKILVPVMPREVPAPSRTA